MSDRSLPRRMLRAARLDAQLYEEVEAERGAIGQALAVVALACAAGAVGTAVRDIGLGGEPFRYAALRLALEVVEPLVLWLGGSLFAYMVGATFLRGPETQTDYREVLRTTGFAFTPGLLRGLVFVPPPPLGLAFAVAADVWMLVCGIVAVRQALDFTTLRAVGTFGSAYALLWLLLTGMLVVLNL